MSATGALKGTGVTLMLSEEMPVGPDLPDEFKKALDVHERLHVTPEQRAERAAHERGEIVLVSWHLWAVLEREGETARFGGYRGGDDAVRLDADPTSALLQIAEDARTSGNLGNLFGDMHRAEMDITRFEFYSAPFRIELSQGLREALRGAWKKREPGDLVSEREHHGG
jgi:hypothetical protein